MREIQAGYLMIPYFKDLYWAKNKLPNTKTAICKVEALAEIHILLDSLLLQFMHACVLMLLFLPQNSFTILILDLLG